MTTKTLVECAIEEVRLRTQLVERYSIVSDLYHQRWTDVLHAIVRNDALRQQEATQAIENARRFRYKLVNFHPVCMDSLKIHRDLLLTGQKFEAANMQTDDIFNNWDSDNEDTGKQTDKMKINMHLFERYFKREKIDNCKHLDILNCEKKINVHYIDNEQW